MSDFLGTVIAGAQIGLDAVLVKPKRGFGPFVAHVTVRELHTDELEITQQPVDQGAAITDHAFMKPAQLEIECSWSDSPPAGSIGQGILQTVSGSVDGYNSIATGNNVSQVKDVYAKLLQLQRSRTPFQVFTGKRAYDNMLVQSLRIQTDRETENSLHVTARFQQVLIAQVMVRTIGAPVAFQADPGGTQTIADKGQKQLTPSTTFNAASALKAGIDAVSARVGNIISNLSSLATSL